MLFNDGSVIRMMKMTLNHIKNVDKGSIEFDESRRLAKDKSEEPINYHGLGGVLGIYGQNGSGKTAIIDCLFLLKSIAFGFPLKSDNRFLYLPKQGSSDSSVEYSFLLIRNHHKFNLKYTISLYSDEPDVNSLEFHTHILNESFSVESLDSKEKYPMIFLSKDNNDIDRMFSDDESFTVAKVLNITKKSNDFIQSLSDLLARKKVDYLEDRSFLFDSVFTKVLGNSENSNAGFISEMIELLKTQVCKNLYCYDTRNDALGTMGCGTLVGTAMNMETNGNSVVGTFPIGIEGAFDIPSDTLKLYQNLLEQINVVVGGFVPGFKAEYRTIGVPHMSKDGQRENTTIEMVRTDIGLLLPIIAESNGIRKFINLASAIICVYNNPSAWLAIDEFDSGVFENLLGQILEVMTERGKGQIVFTSHNLRPLEVINHKNLYFTTMNPENRYVKLQYIKATNNVRDFYLRVLKVGGQKEKMCSETEASQIVSCLFKGGKVLKQVVNHVD